MNVQPDPAWQAHVMVSVVLFFKMLATSVLQVAVRVRSRTFMVPEDAGLFAASTPGRREVPSEVPLLSRLSMETTWRVSRSSCFSHWPTWRLDVGRQAR